MHSVSLILKTKQIIKSYLNFSCVENMREKGSNKVVHVNGLRYGTKYHVLSFLHSFPLFRSLIQIMFIFFESLMTFDLRHWISFSNCKFVWCWILIKFGNTFYRYMHSPIMWASTLKNQLIIFHIHFHILSSRSKPNMISYY